MQTFLTEMPSFNKVLVATDLSAASSAAFQVALNVCSELGASLGLLHVFEYSNAVPPQEGDQFLESKRDYEEARHSLDELIERAREVGVTCEVLIVSGIASSAILDTISSRKINLAILGTNALHGLDRFVFGSTAEEVLRKAPCPVLTVGPRVRDVAARIEGPVIFATDFNLTTMPAIRHAASFSQSTGSSLHCLHVLPRTAEGSQRSYIIPQIMKEALQKVGGTDVKPPICVTAYGSDIANSIVDYATRERAKLIVLGVRRASIVASHVATHLAYQVIAGAPCPVMTVAF